VFLLQCLALGGLGTYVAYEDEGRLTVILNRACDVARRTSHVARVLRSDWLMTFFDNPPSHGHDVSTFVAMRRNAISCLRAKQGIGRRIEIFSAPLLTRDVTTSRECQRGLHCGQRDQVGVKQRF